MVKHAQLFESTQAVPARNTHMQQMYITCTDANDNVSVEKKTEVHNLRILISPTKDEMITY